MFLKVALEVVNDDVVVTTPVPARLADKVPAPVTILRVPVREAPAVGANLTLTVHVPPTANEAAQVVLTKLKSVPLTDAADGTVRVSAVLPVWVSVAVSVDEDPVLTLPKAIEVLIVAVCSHTPVPVRLAVLVPAPVTMLSVPVRATPTEGVN